MLELYDDVRLSDGSIASGRTKLFIKETLDDGTISNCQTGSLLLPDGVGTIFIVDDWLIDQLDKMQFKDGVLSVKEGEQLDEPVKSELEQEEEELLKRLAELRAKKTADTEDTTDEP